MSWYVPLSGLLLQMLGGVRLFRRWRTDTTHSSAGAAP